MINLTIKVTVLLLVLPSILQADSASVSPEQYGIQHLMEYLNLRPQDITYRSDYTEPDSFRLKIVADLMQSPLSMIDYSATLRSACVKRQPEIAAGLLFDDLRGEYQKTRTRAFQPTAEEMLRRYDLYYSNFQLNELLSRAGTYLNVVFPKCTQMALAKLAPKQAKFLTSKFKELLVTHVEEEFFTLEQSDSVEKIEEQWTDSFAVFGSRIDKDPIISAGIDCLKELQPQIAAVRKLVDSLGENADRLLKTGAVVPSGEVVNNLLGKQPGWKIGGIGRDYYSGECRFILDLGGDDVYDLSYDPANPHGVVIIDLGGDDVYRSTTDFTLGSGCLSVGLLLDYSGDDFYQAKSFALGSGFFGFGLLYDAFGDDRYDGDTHIQGAGSFGIGLLIDESGRDMYNGALNAQGFGFVEGAGVLYDFEGSDSYYAGGKYKDVLRYEDHYLSFSQGFGFGMRPQISGGIGALIDLKGNDLYYSDIFAQGTSYWWSLGILYDSTGHDSYHSYQYAQGSATHMTLGILVDDYGNDDYFGKGLMQGCGHDYSCGILLDRHGNDTYTAYDLSQGAGSANGAGLMIDCVGDDRYFVKNPANTQGYGNPRRDFGSIGLFIDMGGSDQYDGNGRDSSYWRTNSQWGGGMDIQVQSVDSAKGQK